MSRYLVRHVGTWYTEIYILCIFFAALAGCVHICLGSPPLSVPGRHGLDDGRSTNFVSQSGRSVQRLYKHDLVLCFCLG